jgi:fibronectin type 3 domain-containing protein
MKNLIFIITISFLLFSCRDKEVGMNENVSTQTETNKELNVFDSSMSNPELFLGSGFGSAFMSFIKTQNFDVALRFTSKESIEEHGVDVIMSKYKSLKTDYTLVKTSLIKDKNKTTLRYTTNEFATSKYKDFVVVIENDSCKLLLPNNLEEFLK